MGRGRASKAQKAIKKKLKQHAYSDQAASEESDAHSGQAASEEPGVTSKKEDFDRSTEILSRYNKANDREATLLLTEQPEFNLTHVTTPSIDEEQIQNWLKTSQKLELKQFIATIFYAIEEDANDLISPDFLMRNKFIDTFADINEEQLAVHLKILSAIPACILQRLFLIKQQNDGVETQQYQNIHKIFIKLIEHNVILCCVNFTAAYYILNTQGAFAEYINMLSQSPDFNNKAFAVHFIETCLFVANNEIEDDNVIFYSCLNDILQTDFDFFATIFSNLMESNDLPEALEHIIYSNRFLSAFARAEKLLENPPIPNIVLSEACVLAHILSDKIMRIITNHKPELILRNIETIATRQPNIVSVIIYTLLNQYLTSFSQKFTAQETKACCNFILNNALKTLDFIIESNFITNMELAYTLQKIGQLIETNLSNVTMIHSFKNIICKIWPKLTVDQQQDFVETQLNFNGILKFLVKDYEADLLKIFVELDIKELVREWCTNAGNKLTNKVTQFIIEGKLSLVKSIIEHNEYELAKKQIALLLTNQKSDAPIPEENCKLLAYAFNNSNEVLDIRPKLLEALMKSPNAPIVLDKILEQSGELLLNRYLINTALENENFKLIQWLLDNKENVTIADRSNSLGEPVDQFLQEQGSLLSQIAGNELNDMIYELAHTQHKQDILIEQVPDILGDMAV